MRTPALTVAAPLAAAWTALYVASKIHLALTGELGVTGGPVVPPEHYAEFGPGGVAAAQWGNAAIGLVGVALMLAPLLPAARQISHWWLTVPIGAVLLMAVSGAVGMLGRAVLTDSGGALFGVYCVVWSLLVAATARAHLSHVELGCRPTRR